MRAAAERLLAPQLRALVRMVDEPILQPIYDLETPRMAFGRIAIIGDAAFVARPHVAAGVAKAADDAAALVAALERGRLRRRCCGLKPRGFRSGGASSSVRATSAPTCRRRRQRRSGTARSAMAFPRRCWRRPRCLISCTHDRCRGPAGLKASGRRKHGGSRTTVATRSAVVGCGRHAMGKTSPVLWRSGQLMIDSTVVDCSTCKSDSNMGERDVLAASKARRNTAPL